MGEVGEVGEVVVAPRSVKEVQEAVRSAPLLLPRGGGSKWGLAGLGAAADGRALVLLDTRGLAGVVEYEPSEFTFTALAGTPVAEVEALLARHGQYLPFDPPFVGDGATLGGTIAAGLSGPCRLRYGGVRDFILGILFVDGEGRPVRGGGKVVKNAAGFDLPKLFCGSRGRLGVIVEATFKVFPRPRAYATVRLPFQRLADAASTLRRLLRSPLEPHAADLVPPGWLAGEYSLLVRVGGQEDVLRSALGRVEELAGLPGERLTGESEAALWQRLRDVAWAPEQAAVVRIHMLPSLLEAVDAVLERPGAARHYSVGGNVAWAAFADPPDWDALERELRRLQVAATVLRGPPRGRVWLTGLSGANFAGRVKAALDPHGRFGAL
ncbi:MAG: FAD-binding protein [Bacillota bacterium]